MTRSINEIAKGFKGKHVLVVGDIMVDRYLRGKVERRSPEADVDVLDHSHTTSKIGGAGNVALNFQALGCRTDIISIVGNDKSSIELETLLDEEGIHHKLIRIEGRPTTVKTRIIADTEHLLRVDFEKTENISPIDERGVMRQVISHINKATPDIVVLQDYNKGLLTPVVISEIISLARSKGIFIAVDPKEENFWLYKGVDLFKPNLRETEQALKLKLSGKYQWKEAAFELMKRLEAKNIAVTLSEHGIFLMSGDNSALVPTEDVEIIDVCGAGDAVLAILSLLVQTGMALTEIGLIANRVGIQVCQSSGVSTIKIEDL